jgi:hypothetical protein
VAPRPRPANNGAAAVSKGRCIFDLHEPNATKSRRFV